MQVLTAVTAVLLVFAEVTAAARGCAQPLVRKEWRRLSNEQRLEYINAVKCLQARPGTTQGLFPGVRSRYDDYQALHINMTELIHFDGPFLPWHRRFLAIWEADLRNTCGYRGAQPYWDWSLDTVGEDSWAQSPVFDSVYGFGGNGEYIEDISNLTPTAAFSVPGRTGGGCVTTGPFANLTVPMGPGYNLTYTPHCLRRDFSPYLANLTLNQSLVDWTEDSDSFPVYDRRVQALNLELSGVTTHGGGHFAVGGTVGEMSNMYSSPGDPLFFLHHGKLDFEWNKWQRRSWPNRSIDIGGPDTMWAYPYNFFGDIPYKNITLAYDLTFGELGTTVNVSEVMDTTSGILCYTYE